MTPMAQDGGFRQQMSKAAIFFCVFATSHVIKKIYTGVSET
jgi:hypothetical protein